VRGLVINSETYEHVKALVPPGTTIHKVDADNGCVVEESLSGVVVELRRGTERAVVRAQFGGPFAASTMLFSATLASVCGVGLKVIREAVEALGPIPGRFEMFSSKPLVIVDYAHTIHALSVLLPYVRSHTSGKLIHVFGAAGGGRDRYKRPIIAELSARSADVSILTEENSFDEPVTDILNDIAKGFPTGHSFEVIPKREDAVARALALATSPNDTVLLTAKGSEHVIVGPRGSKRPYSERAYITWLLKTASSH
jgi:UDP-N-acetylmuramoyl-L-alanyl-D-glutamate--2,6-diaminopimelate ligase